MSMRRVTFSVPASTISNQRSPLVASSSGSSVGVKTVPMLAWKIFDPASE